jgi:hypothetical protein
LNVVKAVTVFTSITWTGPPAPSFFQSTENVQLLETYDGSRNWEHLFLIFPVYFELMRQFSSIPPEGAQDSLLN